MITEVGPGKVYLDYGPMQMTISAYAKGHPVHLNELQQAGEYAQELLAQVAANLVLAKLPHGQIRKVEALPPILRNMVEAVQMTGDPSLTSMAAVAGSLADAVADYLAARGATKVLVNNGGDIALRLAAGESTKVGIASEINAPTFTHILSVDYTSQIRGITTSGLGGRSFTKGIATAAVALGANSRLADACATLIGNHTYSPDPEIIQVLAEEIDPDTDIAGHLVTSKVGRLEASTQQKALSNGMAKARELIEQKVIIGAVVFIGQNMACEPESLNITKWKQEEWK